LLFSFAAWPDSTTTHSHPPLIKYLTFVTIAIIFFSQAGMLALHGPLTHMDSVNFLEEKDKAVAQEEARLQEGRTKREAKKEESKKRGLSVWADVSTGKIEVASLNGEQLSDILLHKGTSVPKGCTKVQQKRDLITGMYSEEVAATRAAAAALNVSTAL
jgi:hypothetical protein